MKANLKGLGGIKGLALRHGEKILISVVGLLALWFVYSSLKLPRLEEQYQADKLQSQITETNRAIQESSWPDADNEAAPEVRPYKPIEQKLNAPVKAKDYPFDGLNPPLMAGTLLRGDPIVLNAVELRVTGNSGLMAFKDEKTLAEQERRRKLKEEELAKKQERDQAKQLEEGAGEGGRRGGRQGRGDEGMNAGEYDPDHPNRRMIQGVGSPAGIPLQGAERLERVYWATIVAKVPIREQLKLFQDAFRDARGYDAARDFPQYVGYLVERSEVVPGKQPEWKRVYVYDGQKKLAGKLVDIATVTKLNEIASIEWGGVAVEPVDPRWTDAVLTLPLPPLVGRNFGADATHPDIPLAINAPPVEATQAPAAAPAEKPAEGDDDMMFSGVGAAGAGSVQGRTGMAGFAGAEYSGSRSYAGVPPGGAGLGGNVSSVAGGISSERRVELPPEVDFLLLRFFDFTVEQGKEYTYRVKLVLHDPNYAVPIASGYLDPAVIDRKTKESRAAKEKGRSAPFYRLAEEWSEPSGVVGIPTGGGVVHVAEAKLPSSKVHNDEPAVKVMAEMFDVDPADNSAIHVAHEKEFRRGAVVNMREKMQFTGENDTWIDTKDSYELNTGLTLLDIDGSDKLIKDVTSPTRVLLMDVSGQLSVRDELNDKPDVEYLRYVFSDDKRRDRSDQSGEGSRGGGGRQRRP